MRLIRNRLAQIAGFDPRLRHPRSATLRVSRPDRRKKQTIGSKIGKPGELAAQIVAAHPPESGESEMQRSRGYRRAMSSWIALKALTERNMARCALAASILGLKICKGQLAIRAA